MSELHPTGTFNDTEIIDHGFAESGEKKSLYFWVKFRTPESETYGDLIGSFYLTEKAAEQTVKKIDAMGFDGDNLEELADGTKLVGNVVQITVEHDTWEGTTRAKVGWVNRNNAIVGPTHDEAAAAKTKQFNALWRKNRTKIADDADVPF